MEVSCNTQRCGGVRKPASGKCSGEARQKDHLFVKCEAWKAQIKGLCASFAIGAAKVARATRAVLAYLRETKAGQMITTPLPAEEAEDGARGMGGPETALLPFPLSLLIPFSLAAQQIGCLPMAADCAWLCGKIADRGQGRVLCKCTCINYIHTHTHHHLLAASLLCEKEGLGWVWNSNLLLPGFVMAFRFADGFVVSFRTCEWRHTSPRDRSGVHLFTPRVGFSMLA